MTLIIWSKCTQYWPCESAFVLIDRRGRSRSMTPRLAMWQPRKRSSHVSSSLVVRAEKWVNGPHLMHCWQPISIFIRWLLDDQKSLHSTYNSVAKRRAQDSWENGIQTSLVWRCRLPVSARTGTSLVNLRFGCTILYKTVTSLSSTYSRCHK